MRCRALGGVAVEIVAFRFPGGFTALLSFGSFFSLRRFLFLRFVFRFFCPQLDVLADYFPVIFAVVYQYFRSGRYILYGDDEGTNIFCFVIAVVLEAFYFCKPVRIVRVTCQRFRSWQRVDHVRALYIKDIAVAAVFILYIFPGRDYALVFNNAFAFGYKFLGK